MREIEVKAKVESFGAVIKRLEELGCTFSTPIIQEDAIFLRSGIRFDDITSGTNVLRIRVQEDSSYLTLKKPQANELDCIEREVKINNPGQMRDILEFMGYREVVFVKKERVKTKAGDYNICLDKVEDLGAFIEVELLTQDNSSYEMAQDRLFDFLLTLGISKENRVTVGYDTMIYSLESK